jgi:shikimate dehydrogenase
MPTLTGKTQLLGVIGYPVSHSLSPVMHNAVLRHQQLDYVYTAFPIAPENLKLAIAGLGMSGVKGLNVTIPHKQTVMSCLTSVSTVAEQVGAVNTLTMGPRGWTGTNTDVEGFMAPLLTLNRDWGQVNPMILGNGGAARAVVVACYQLGCPQITVVGRTSDKRKQFQSSWNDHRIKDRLNVVPWEALPSLMPQVSLLVNTTPIGMAPHGDQSPLDATLMAQVATTAIAYDLIYTPRPTQFLRLAQQHGLQTIDGLDMLVAQGAAALKIWLNQEMPIKIMRQALIDYLEQDQATG